MFRIKATKHVFGKKKRSSEDWFEDQDKAFFKIRNALEIGKLFEKRSGSLKINGFS